MHPCAFVALFTANNFHSITKKESGRFHHHLASHSGLGCVQQRERKGCAWKGGGAPFPRLRLEGMFLSGETRGFRFIDWGVMRCWWNLVKGDAHLTIYSSNNAERRRGRSRVLNSFVAEDHFISLISYIEEMCWHVSRYFPFIFVLGSKSRPLKICWPIILSILQSIHIF